MSFFKRKGEEAPLCSCNVNRGEQRREPGCGGRSGRREDGANVVENAAAS
ncbi:uncharacterized protein V6R79_015488 [Siganus canaliculatus]